MGLVLFLHFQKARRDSRVPHITLQIKACSQLLDNELYTTKNIEPPPVV